ncbi:MAG: RNA polymerase sigma factor [Paramuribaculum sp.]|nr:RNA polymerase sigma factor [Paramuribaculum sp.]
MSTQPLIDAYSELKDKLHAMAISMLHSESEAMDAVHDAFYNLLKSTPPASHSEATAKFITSVRNICINKLKRNKPILGYDICQSCHYDDTPPPDINIRQLLSILPPLQRKVFELAILHDYEYPEIADKLQISIEAVRMNMSRARIKLRAQYNKLNK